MLMQNRQSHRPDAAIVAALQRLGAVLLGKANMHEVGLGASGINPAHGACRNPCDLDHLAGEAELLIEYR